MLFDDYSWICSFFHVLFTLPYPNNYDYSSTAPEDFTKADEEGALRDVRA
jgi:hypothetical protein